MMDQQTHRRRRLLLIGAGHAHAGVLRSIAEMPIPGVEIILVSPSPGVPSSGMLPAWLAGHYRWDEICIDFPSLCRRAGAQFLLDTVSAIDPDANQVTLASGAVLNYDFISLNIGPTLVPPAHAGFKLIPLRPLYQLQQPWQDLQDQVGQLAPGSKFAVLMVGAGAAGVESILAMQHALSALAPQVQWRFTLAGAGSEILNGIAPIAAHRLERRLAQRGIHVVRNFSALRCEGDAVLADDGRALKADCVFWATAAEAHRWPRASALLVDKAGFVRINHTLRSISHPNVFAVGDCASWDTPLPKAGVFAVRMGPVLAHNLRAAFAGEPLLPYRPQRRFLTLIGTGDENAVASWGIVGFEGKWVWRWKQRIDQRFLAAHR